MSDDDSRPVRKAPARSGPNRRVSGAFSSGPPSGPLEAGVAAAYRLIEEYMIRGRYAAQQLAPWFGPPGFAGPGAPGPWAGRPNPWSDGSGAGDATPRPEAGASGPGQPDPAFNPWANPYDMNNMMRAWLDMYFAMFRPLVDMTSRGWGSAPFMGPNNPNWAAHDEGWAWEPDDDGDAEDDVDFGLGDPSWREARDCATEVLIASDRVTGTLELHRRAPNMSLRMLGDASQPPLELRSALFSKTGATVVLCVDVVHEGREPGVYLGAVLDDDAGTYCGLLELHVAAADSATD